MHAFLVIYSKSGSIGADVLPVISGFGMNDTRRLVKKERKGIVFYTGERFAENLYENEASISFVAGHISFEKLNNPAVSSASKTWNEVISRKESPSLAELEGMFAAIHYDQKEHVLRYANDKFGIAPLFVYEDRNYVMLCNEYQPLAKYTGEMDTSAIAEFLTLGVTLGSKTFFRRIKNLEPASFMRVSSGITEQRLYWEPDLSPEKNADTQSLAKEMHTLFTKVNREYQEAKHAGVCLLTAGADSRLIVSAMTEEQLQGATFYTSNLSFLDPLEDKDVVGASAITSKFNLKHRIEKISFHENSFDDSYFETARSWRGEQVYGGWHGGELLGGFCFHSAPIRQPLDYQAVDTQYRSLFSWWFRLRQRTHPYASYQKELERLKGHELLFMIHQMTRSFFTAIYGGTRGHWEQPFQLVNHGYSPFWDSRLLQLLLRVPVEELKHYRFYNEVFKHVDKAFTGIPSNSPLTTREDSVLPKMETGIEPKHRVPNTHHKAYKSYLNDASVFRRGYYNKKLRAVLEKEFDPGTQKWLDLEVWYSRYVSREHKK